jgi:hypothetical protein
MQEQGAKGGEGRWQTAKDGGREGAAGDADPFD